MFQSSLSSRAHVWRRFQMILAAGLLAILGVCATQREADATERPNIIVVLSDDMGYSDIGCYGGEIDTPTLDGLAANGLRFTQFYNTGRCCPTRASLLTGLYPHQAGVGHMMNDRGYDGYRGELNRRSVTIAEVLRTAGYATYMAGKWHVTKGTQPEGPKDNWPLQRGFDRFYGTITGAGSFFDPGTLTRDNTMISPFADPEYQPEEYYYTDAISDHAVRFIREHEAANDEQPFFMYVAYTCAHWPMHATEEDIAAQRGRYVGGYAPVRQQRLERLAQMGLMDSAWEPAPLIGSWDEVEHQAWEARCMEVYAAMIVSMDRGIGRIVDTLQEHDELDTTLILYMQDNGGCQEGNGRRGDFARPVPPSLPPIPADAIRLDVVPRQNRAGVPTLTGPGIMPGPEDTYIAYGLNWANVSNTPFREYKHFVHEGGIATPLIAHWPPIIQNGGGLDSQPAHLIDIMATCVDIGNADYPDSYQGQSIQPLEGVSLVPAFVGKSLEREGPLYWEHEGNRAIRDGRWKLVAKENRPWELYDMEVDRPELNDLAATHPERAERMAAAWDAWAERANVLPLGAWRSNNNVTLNRTQREFSLKPGDSLPRGDAPFVQGRPVSIAVEIDRFGADGVLVAQGGTAQGYSLYLVDGRLHFAVRRHGELEVVASDMPLEASAGTVTARLRRNGTVTLEWNGSQVARDEVSGLLTQMPVDGLHVGRDDGGAVGDYSSPFPFTGGIRAVTIELPRAQRRDQ